MARKDTATVAEAEAAQADAAQPADEAAVAITEGTTGEQPATTEGTASTEAAAPAEPDLTKFKAAAAAAITSGEFEAVNAAYNELDRAGKGQATRYVNDEIKRQLVEVKDKDAAFAWGQLGQSLKTVKAAKAKEAKVPVNRTEAVVDNLSSLYLAYQTAKSAVEADTTGLDEDWASRIQPRIEAVRPEVDRLLAFRNAPEPTEEAKAAEGYVEPTEPDVSDVARRAVRLAFQGASAGRKSSSGSGSSGPTYAGPRRSISKHIEEAFDAHPVGTFLSVAQIRAFESSEYGKDLPSAGAISAALKSPKWDSALHGVEGGKGGEKNTYGATKVAKAQAAA